MAGCAGKEKPCGIAVLSLFVLTPHRHGPHKEDKFSPFLRKAGNIMIKLSNMADYAVLIMSHMAQRGTCRHAAPEIVQATGVPAATTAKLLGALARGGLLVSQRGIAGGFALARPAEHISVADIIEAVDGPIALTNCLGDHAGDCSLESICATRPHWTALNTAVRAALAQVSLAEMAMPDMAFMGLQPKAPMTMEKE